ncbi:uncharacterized protein LOC111691430 [Anoplophora glabripennis]|uniref:uncharacterized protein LOC111691430 n=1 Tax=Anoplophora glabripennis TaxID=217634 RepID=UPI000C766998|nr:uncharacterized protein LOC111691430 [Anoplophora glabripennis]
MPRHNNFSNSEMRDMICVFAQANFNGHAAARRYEHMYPNRLQPNYKLFRNLYNRLGESGSFRPKSNHGTPKSITVDEEEEILIRVSENSGMSTRRLSAATGVSQSSICRILKKEMLHPYHYTPVQQLLPQDLPARLQFAQFVQNMQMENPDFLNRILFTDEATFTRRGVFNWKNNHLWDSENPHAVKEKHFQHEFKVNIWCGLISGKDFNILDMSVPSGPY